MLIKILLRTLLTGVLFVLPAVRTAHSAFDSNAVQKLLASDAVSSDYFGFSVAVDGDTALIGAWGDDDGGDRSGSAYIFTRSEGVWTQQAKLTASDASIWDYFGGAVALSGDTALIGASRNDHAGDWSGAAYVFTRSGGVWTQQAKLTASDATSLDYFGQSLSLSGDTALIGAWGDDNGGDWSGAAYVFIRSGGVWTQQAKLTASDPATQANFGRSVSLSGNTALVGADYDNNDGLRSGAAYVFTRSGGVWTEQTKLTASDAAASDWFGISVSLSGDTALIGAYLDDDGCADSGSAYVFVRAGDGTWSEQAKLTASDSATNDLFGGSVVVDGDTALVGAYQNDDGGTDSGSAYVFTRNGTTWTQQQKLTAPDETAEDRFGVFVSLSGDTALIGANSNDDDGTDSGSAYIFTESGGNSNALAPIISLLLLLNNKNNDLNIPEGHPRLWWNADRLDQAKEWYATHLFEPSSDTGLYGDPLGNAFKYLLTGETQYCGVAMGYVNAALDTFPMDGLTCDECRWHGENIITVYDWCYDALSQDDLNLIRDRMNETVAYWNTAYWGGTGTTEDGQSFAESNYYWGYLRNSLMWGIASHGENPEAPAFVEHALQGRWEGISLPHIASCNGSGIPAEGTSYGPYVLHYPLIPFASMELFGRDMMFGDSDFYAKAVFSTIYQALPDTFLNPGATTAKFSLFPYGDAAPFAQDYNPTSYSGGAAGPAQDTRLAEFMTYTAQHFGSNPIAGFARRWIARAEQGLSEELVQYYLASLGQGGEEQLDFSLLPLDYYGASSCMAQAYARSSWDSNNNTALHLQLISPPLLGHEHRDSGNWQLRRKGRWLVREISGRGNNSGWNIPGYAGQDIVDVQETIAHNTLLFGGEGQATTGSGVPELLRLESRDDFFFAVSDLTPGYHSSIDNERYGNEHIAHAEREFLFVRPLESLIILDRMESADTNTAKTFLMHVQNTLQTSGSNSYLNVNGDQTVRLTTLVPAEPIYRVIDQRNAKYPYSYRLEVETSGTGIQYFLHVVQARDSSASDLDITFEENETSFVINLLKQGAPGCAKVVLDKGLHSSGGQFGYAVDATDCSQVELTALRDGIQPITVNSQGVSWEK
ncbi:MAG: FG-GAP repeat protein [Candidatus Electrothrix aestuarii]|uniref:FG-GAP repeat protein n=1 Tax=Candidatus Electrothrix aestuarii TaxID=3062594 RepID=A0AAU8LYK3_9BACT|nr:FG-GAP repeat protein [Candidatus Electrothrix aestuarii]